MASVNDVAAYILHRKGSMSTWKLQKLAYYAQAWHLAWRDSALFDSRIEAWANGPVVRELYNQHRGYFNVDVWRGQPGALTPDQQVVIDSILGAYGDLSGRQLSYLTHMESPWRDARAGLGPTERSEAEITWSSMAAFYSALDVDERARPVAELDWSSADA